MAGSLDDVARNLAAPMPRRRALRLLGAALAVTALPAARPGSVQARATSRHVSETGRDLRVVPPQQGPWGDPVPCGDVVCNPTFNCVKCCMQSNGQPGSCCPCYFGCSPTGSGLCATPFACPPDARPYCGKKGTCCNTNEFCFKGSVCVPICAAGEQLCDGDCCPKGSECITAYFPGRAGGVRVCSKKCPPRSSRCGLVCCHGRNKKCINPKIGLCAPCDPGHLPCGKKCCAKGSRCCDPRKGLCCKAGEVCAGFGDTAKCCPKGTKACETAPGSGKPKCCAKGEVCAQVADASGTVPLANLRKFVCCPKDRTVAFSGGGAVSCCPEGYRSLGGRFIVPPGGGGGLCCRNDKLCGDTCCGTNGDPGIDQTCCNGACVSLYFDAANCGGCGNVCPAGTVCRAGACVTG